NALRQPTPISKPSSTVPAMTTRTSKVMKVRGSQNSGASGGMPSAIASVSIMYPPSRTPPMSCHRNNPIPHVMPQQLQKTGHADRINRQQGQPACQQHRDGAAGHHLGEGHRTRDGIGESPQKDMGKAGHGHQPAAERAGHQPIEQPPRQGGGVSCGAAQAPPGPAGQRQDEQGSQYRNTQ